MSTGCQHYYGDNIGDGWLKCVKCGAPPPDDWPSGSPPRPHTIRACCNTLTTEPHGTVCQSLDARQRRGQKGLVS